MATTSLAFEHPAVKEIDRRQLSPCTGGTRRLPRGELTLTDARREVLTRCDDWERQSLGESGDA